MFRYTSPLTKKERATLLANLRTVSLQDVNADETYKIDSNLIEIIKTKVFPLFLSKTNLKRVATVDTLNLNSNIDIHNDINYIRSRSLQKIAYLVIFDLKHKRIDYPDTPRETYFFHNKTFISLSPITAPYDNFYAIPFNASIDHGLMLNGKLRGFVIFLYKHNI